MTRSALFFLLPVLIIFTQISTTPANEPLKKVLLLHSYHSGYKWTDDVNTSILKDLTRTNGFDLRVEYLDTKRFSSQAYYDLQREVLGRKYKDEVFDVVVCSDNNALSFLLNHRQKLFPEVPVVFTGVNYFKKEILQGQTNITGVNEAADVKKNIDLMLSIHPGAKRIIVAIDETVTGKLLRDEINGIRDDYPSVEWLIPSDLTMEQLEELLQTLTPDDVVLLGLFLRDSTGKYYEYDEVSTRISTSSTAPVYVLWDFYLEYGVVGGYLASGTYQGTIAAMIIKRIVAGSQADDIPVVMESPNRYLADYSAMSKFGIDVEQFPPETIIYNQSPDFYKEHKLAIWVFSFLFVVLSFLTLFLSINIARKKKAETALLALTEELEDRVQSRTEQLSLANQDISEREQQMQNLLTNLSSMIYRCKNDENWTMIFVSDGSIQLTGYEAEDLIDNNVIAYADLIDKRDRQMVADVVDRAIAEKENFTIEYRIHTKDNQTKWVWEQGIVMYDDKGEVLFLDGKIMDVSERKQIELEQKKLAIAVQQTDDLVLITDLSGSIEYVNPAFENTTGYLLREVFGQNPSILKSGKQSEDFYKEMWTTLNAGTVWRGRLENRRKDGSEYTAEVTISPIRDQLGDLTNFVGVQRDISHEIALEKNLRQSQKLEAMGTLAGGIAHEINTPAQFVNSNLEFTIDSFPDIVEYVDGCTHLFSESNRDDNKIQELIQLYQDNDVDYLLKEFPLALEQSQQGIEQVSKIVLSMKQFAHPADEKKEEVDINDALNNTATVSRNEWRHAADMAFDLDPTLPMVSCHRSEVNQVFLNIIVNAAHAIAGAEKLPGGKGKINIGSRLIDNSVEVSIADNGGGIPESNWDRVFDPFFTTKEPGKGTGQGLAIAHSIIHEKHEGQLFFDSVDGVGTTFFIRFPL